MHLNSITFDDKTQTIWWIVRDSHDGKAIARRFEEHIEDKKEYFKRKLMGK